MISKPCIFKKTPRSRMITRESGTCFFEDDETLPSSFSAKTTKYGSSSVPQRLSSAFSCPVRASSSASAGRPSILLDPSAPGSSSSSSSSSPIFRSSSSPSSSSSSSSAAERTSIGSSPSSSSSSSSSTSSPFASDLSTAPFLVVDDLLVPFDDTFLLDFCPTLLRPVPFPPARESLARDGTESSVLPTAFFPLPFSFLFALAFDLALGPTFFVLDSFSVVFFADEEPSSPAESEFTSLLSDSSAFLSSVFILVIALGLPLALPVAFTLSSALLSSTSSPALLSSSFLLSSTSLCSAMLPSAVALPSVSASTPIANSLPKFTHYTERSSFTSTKTWYL
mmetsp:Transcript_21599/g.42422  ORF Transcript_21599/g.42422 Transcript_21599/m.42422 type:complete len:338 (+) Transcript_21599:2012-3025(+)